MKTETPQNFEEMIGALTYLRQQVELLTERIRVLEMDYKGMESAVLHQVHVEQQLVLTTATTAIGTDLQGKPQSPLPSRLVT